MEPVCKPESDSTIFRLNAGYRFRVSGSDARNDGVQIDADFGHQSERFADDRLSREIGITVDPFGETLDGGAYLQLNFHASDRWTLSLRSVGALASDRKETVNATTQADGSIQTEDSDDLGGLFEGDLLGTYRLNSNLILGLRVGYNLQAYGTSGTDQGTQHSLSTLLNFAYKL